MKVRIVEHEQNHNTWYTVQYKYFLFWHTTVDVFDCDNLYPYKEDAIDAVKKLCSKEKKSVVYEIETK